MNDEGEEDTARRAENTFRKANSFSTIEIVDEAEGFAFARFIISETWQKERFEGVGRKAWPNLTCDRYRGLLSKAITTYEREKQVRIWLQEWPGVATLEEIPDPTPQIQVVNR